jgi:phage anti-repressor protein
MIKQKFNKEVRMVKRKEDGEKIRQKNKRNKKEIKRKEV